ncbi:MAG: hypothetical protein FJZ01_14820 [Candidatus Sericytochromatia bacterium]|nr:hypothetical protein [Candidatus Tanganyikabacteria bacterium]
MKAGALGRFTLAWLAIASVAAGLIARDFLTARPRPAPTFKGEVWFMDAPPLGWDRP